MRVITAYPPNYAKLKGALAGASNPAAIFCYGAVVYNPSGQPLTDALLAHEEVHSRQQGADPEAWWDRYIADKQFRFDQELPAHVVEYRVAARGASRQTRRGELKNIVDRLSGPLYGRLISFERAKRLIRDMAARPEMETV